MAHRLRLASERRDAAVMDRNASTEAWKAWEDAAQEWCAARDAMFGEAFDKSPDPHLAAIRAGEPAGVETAIRFLETDPICFHAGYAEERFLRALKAVVLSTGQARRLRIAMTHALEDKQRHEMEDVASARVHPAGIQAQLIPHELHSRAQALGARRGPTTKSGPAAPPEPI